MTPEIGELLDKGHSRLMLPFQKLFVRLSNLALDATGSFHIPVSRIAELCGQVEI